jgi:hypothetical protein
MRKLDLMSYSFGESKFEVRPSVVAVLFNEENLDGREIIRRDELARKIEDFEGDEILLEEAEWAKIVSGLNASNLKPHGRSIVEFVRRILDAPKVEVTEKS